MKDSGRFPFDNCSNFFRWENICSDCLLMNKFPSYSFIVFRWEIIKGTRKPPKTEASTDVLDSVFPAHV